MYWSIVSTRGNLSTQTKPATFGSVKVVAVFQHATDQLLLWICHPRPQAQAQAWEGLGLGTRICKRYHCATHAHAPWFVINDQVFDRMKCVIFSSQTQVVDGPDDQGNMFERPGKVGYIVTSITHLWFCHIQFITLFQNHPQRYESQLKLVFHNSYFMIIQLSDYLPHPYPNEEAARAANEGMHHRLILRLSIQFRIHHRLILRLSIQFRMHHHLILRLSIQFRIHHHLILRLSIQFRIHHHLILRLSIQFRIHHHLILRLSIQFRIKTN